MPEPRGQPRDVVQRLDDVGRARARRSRRGSRRSRRSGARRGGTAQKSGWSKTVAIASRQRDCRTSAKSRIASRSKSSYSAGQLDQAVHAVARPGGPVDDQPVGGLQQLPDRLATRAAARRATTPSPAGRGRAAARRARTGAGRSRRRRSGRSARCRSPARPARGSTQWAWMRASIHGGPSGSAPWTTSVRDGWRPVSRLMVSALRSPTSGWRATTTRFITDVRAAMWRPPWPPSVGRRPPGSAAPRCAPARARSPRSSAPGSSSAASARRVAAARSRAICPPPAGRVPTAITSPNDRFGPSSGRRRRDRRRSDPPPPAALARQHVVGGLRAPGAGLVVRELGRRHRRPACR